MRFRIGRLLLIVAFAAETAALADAPTVRIEQQAILAPGGVVVIVDVTCGDGASDAAVLVGVRQGSQTSENAAPFNSSGDRQRVGVFVPGAFTVGDASASAVLECGLLLAGTELGATIRISE